MLGALLDREEEARADSLAAELDLPVSTVYRYLRGLRAAGFVTESDGAYRVGDRLVGTRPATPSQTDLRLLAQPTLERLTAASGETSLIAVRSHTQALCLDQVGSPHTMRVPFRVGRPSRFTPVPRVASCSPTRRPACSRRCSPISSR